MEPVSPVRLLRAVLLPALWLPVVPILALFFVVHVESSWDSQLRDALRQSVSAQVAAAENAEERAQTEAFLASFAGSEVCASSDPALASMQAGLAEACGDYAQIRWMGHGAVVSLLLAAGAALVAFVASVAAFGSRSAQVPALAAAWNILRVTSAAQVVVQGSLLVALSYWLPGFFIERFYPQLLLVVVALAGMGAWAALRALFARVEVQTGAEARPVAEADAPLLWARIRALAERIGTAPPAQVLAGIDENFFVTEHPFTNGTQTWHGRTLFVSLGLVRTMSKGETEAVLCHELAHFSGGDTEQSVRLSPMLEGYRRYLEVLAAQPLARPAFYAMRSFFELFRWALARTSRARELRADRVAAEHTSPEAIAGSLVRVAAWSRWRSTVEQELFAQRSALEGLDIPARVREGFRAFAAQAHLPSLLTAVPHPWDSHPPNGERIAAVGADLPPERWSAHVASDPGETWYDAIGTAGAIEAELWAAYQRRFEASHDLKRAFEINPRTPEEVAVVERHFPRVVVRGKQGQELGAITWRALELTSLPGPVPLGDVDRLYVKEKWFQDRLFLHAGASSWNVKLRPLADRQGFLLTLARYHARARHASGHGPQR